MPQTVVPLSDLNRRAPEAGRIRMGRKVKTSSGKEAPAKTDAFRFTSPHANLIQQLASIYGGDVEPWNEPKSRVKHQWQVLTTSTKIHVYLPADGISQHYEKWSGGGCERRCDGVTVQTTHTVGEAVVVDESPCICMAKGIEECKPHTRLTVILPELPFYGTWRLDSQGRNARDELPGMYDLIVSLQAQQSMTTAMLSMEQRSEVRNGKTRHFVVPVLTVEQSPLEILAGHADVHQISARGDVPALESPHPTPTRPTNVDDDGVIIAEVVGGIEDQLRADAIHFGLDPELFVAAVMATGNEERMHADMIAALVEPTGFTATGKVRWKQLEQETP
jgi:hypothetical protein